MSIADIFTVVIALLALLVNVVFVTFQITWSITQDRAKDQKDKKEKVTAHDSQSKRLLFFFS